MIISYMYCPAQLNQPTLLGGTIFWAILDKKRALPPGDDNLTVSYSTDQAPGGSPSSNFVRSERV